MQTILDTYTPIVLHRPESLWTVPYANLLYHSTAEPGEWITDLTDDEYILFLCFLETLRLDAESNT